MASAGYYKRGDLPTTDVLVVGAVGVMPDAYKTIDDRLRAMGWNWTRLAEAVGVRRQTLGHAYRSRGRVSRATHELVMSTIGLAWRDFLREATPKEIVDT